MALGPEDRTWFVAAHQYAAEAQAWVHLVGLAKRQCRSWVARTNAAEWSTAYPRPFEAAALKMALPTLAVAPDDHLRLARQTVADALVGRLVAQDPCSAVRLVADGHLVAGPNVLHRQPWIHLAMLDAYAHPYAFARHPVWLVAVAHPCWVAAAVGPNVAPVAWKARVAQRLQQVPLASSLRRPASFLRPPAPQPPEAVREARQPQTKPLEQQRMSLLQPLKLRLRRPLEPTASPVQALA